MFASFFASSETAVQAALQAAGAAASLPETSYGVALLRSVLALIGITLLAWVILRFARDRMLPAQTGAQLKVIETLTIERSPDAQKLSLVRVGTRHFLIGTSSRSAPRLIAELNETDLAAQTDSTEPPSAAEKSFRSLLKK